MKIKTKKECWIEFLKKYPQPETGMANQETSEMIDLAFKIGYEIGINAEKYY